MLYAVEHSYLWVLVALVLMRLFTYDRVFFLVVVLISMVPVTRLLTHSDPVIKRQTFSGTVTSVESDRDHPRFFLKDEDYRLLVYGDGIEALSAGMRVQIEGEAVWPQASGFFGGFDYRAHLRAIRVDGIVYEAAITPRESGMSVYSVSGWLSRHIELTNPDTAPYLKAFLLADRSGLDETTYHHSQTLGIAHMFAVSGLHVAFLAFLIRKGLTMVVRHPVSCDILFILFLVGYLGITGAPPSVLRAVAMVCLLIFNKHLNLGLSVLDCLLILCMGLLVIHPFYFSQLGFLLSFTVSITLVFNKAQLGAAKKVHQPFLVSGLAFFATLPLILSMQYEINPLSIIYNVFFVLFLTFLLLPLSYIVFLLPIFEPLLAFLLAVFELIVGWLADRNGMIIRLFIPPGIVTIFYYVLFAYAFSQIGNSIRLIRRLIVLVYFLLLIGLSPYLSFVSHVYMFDVSGDSFLIRDRFNRCNILIDTGERDPQDRLVSQLKRLNLRHLDYVIITHKHSDHYGAYPSVAANFEIGQTISNHSQGPFENRLIGCGDLTFFIFPLEKDHRGENERSLVMSITIGGERYLFTGDIESAREESFVRFYDVRADILKVAHHGSRTSSTERFLKMVQASEGIVPASRNSRFGHPHDEAIDRLEAHGVLLHRLDETGSVHFRYFFSFRHKKTALEPGLYAIMKGVKTID